MTHNYKIGIDQFFSYSFSLDCLIFGFRNGQIHLLIIKRDMDPFKGEWAIPGDLVYPDEDLEEAASRILFDLTRINNVELHQSQTFGKPSRHPLGRVITCAYFALVQIDDIHAEPSSWANEVKWVPIHQVPSLAFDHNLIVSSTFDILKNKLTNEPICFDLLPPKFALNDMQQLYEYAFNQDLNKANFRKKIKSIPFIDHDEKQKNVKHRPARLFSFDQKRYKTLVEKEQYIFKM
jgi:8-oxo-dGTP diphosphatase